MDRPRYMNAPSPAPCHVNVAGVGKQSVWGLRIIAGTQLSLWHYSVNSSMRESEISRVCLRLNRCQRQARVPRTENTARE